MKKILFVICLLSTAAAFAQSAGMTTFNPQPQVYQYPDHPAHAGYTPLSQGQNILGAWGYASAQGERRPSDFPQPEGVSLGAVARELRKQHDQLKKSRVVWVNQ